MAEQTPKEIPKQEQLIGPGNLAQRFALRFLEDIGPEEKYGPESRLPSIPAVQEEYGIGKHTVTTGYNLLGEIIETHRSVVGQRIRPYASYVRRDVTPQKLIATARTLHEMATKPRANRSADQAEGPDVTVILDRSALDSYTSRSPLLLKPSHTSRMMAADRTIRRILTEITTRVLPKGDLYLYSEEKNRRPKNKREQREPRHYSLEEKPETNSEAVDYVRDLWQRREKLPDMQERYKKILPTLKEQVDFMGLPEEDINWVMAIAASYLTTENLPISQILFVTQAIINDAILLQGASVAGDVVGMAMLNSLSSYIGTSEIADSLHKKATASVGKGETGEEVIIAAENADESRRRVRGVTEAPFYHNTQALITAVTAGKRIEWPHVSQRTLGGFLRWFAYQIQDGLPPSMLGSDDLRLPKDFIGGHTLGGLYNVMAREAKKRDDVDPILVLSEKAGIVMTGNDVIAAINLERPIQWARVTPSVLKDFLERVRILETDELPPISLWRREDFLREFTSLAGTKLTGLVKHFYKKSLASEVDAITEMKQFMDLHLSVEDIFLSFKLDRPVPWGQVDGEVLKNFLDQVSESEGDRLPPVSRWGEVQLREKFAILGGKSLYGLYEYFLTQSQTQTKDPIILLREKININPTIEDAINAIQANQRIYWGRMSNRVIYGVLERAAHELGIPIIELTVSALRGKFAFLDGHTLTGIVNHSFVHRITLDETTQQAIMRLARVEGFMLFEQQSVLEASATVTSPATEYDLVESGESRETTAIQLHPQPESSRHPSEGQQRINPWTAGKLLDDIRSGAYRLGNPLPNETELMARYDVSRRAILFACSELAAEGIGIIISLPGKGRVLASTLPAEEILDELAARFGPIDQKPPPDTRHHPRGEIGGKVATLKENLRSSIQNGKLRSGQTVNSHQFKIRLAETTGISPSRISKAIGDLVIEGYVETERDKITFRKPVEKKTQTTGPEDPWESEVYARGDVPIQQTRVLVKKPPRIVAGDLGTAPVNEITLTRGIQSITAAQARESYIHDTTYLYVPINWYGEVSAADTPVDIEDLLRRLETVAHPGQTETETIRLKAEAAKLYKASKDDPFTRDKTIYYDDSGQPFAVKVYMIPKEHAA